MTDAALVEGWYDQKVVAGQHIKERRYRLTKAGARALAETRAFYLERALSVRLVRKASHA